MNIKNELATVEEKIATAVRALDNKAFGWESCVLALLGEAYAANAKAQEAIKKIDVMLG